MCAVSQALTDQNRKKMINCVKGEGKHQATFPIDK